MVYFIANNIFAKFVDFLFHFFLASSIFVCFTQRYMIFLKSNIYALVFFTYSDAEKKFFLIFSNFITFIFGSFGI